MIIVHVQVHVKPEFIETFRMASVENAQNSVKEPGIIRFDVLQQQDDPTRFVLVEIYRADADTMLHKETEHYKNWRDVVANMMAEPRSSLKYNPIFPEESMWT